MLKGRHFQPIPKVMKLILAGLFALLLVTSTKASKVPAFNPSEEEISAHRLEVFKLARDYVIKTFNFSIVEESEFNPVRFNSMGVWGDFESRLKELGDDRFEVQGWIVPEGHFGKMITWYVVVEYALEDPDAWRYRWVNREYTNEAKFTSWKLIFGNAGRYSSVPYLAEYSEGFLESRSKKEEN